LEEEPGEERIVDSIPCDDPVRRFKELSEASAQALAQSVKGVQDLRRWAEQTRAVKPEIHHRMKSAQRALVRNLESVYRQAFGRKPGVSRDPNTRKPSGPFFRFIRAAFAEIGVHRSPETLVSMWKKTKRGESPTARSYQGRPRRLPLP
jgi:hypothetical protein